jgi:hypothetical protein
VVPFRVFAASHSQTGFPHLRSGVSTILRNRLSLIPDPRPLTSSISCRINTCKTVSKQTTLTPFRMNTYRKQGEGAVRLSNQQFRPRVRFSGSTPPCVLGSLFSLIHQRAFGNFFAANTFRTLSKSCRVCGYGVTDPAFSFYSPCAILPPGGSAGSITTKPLRFCNIQWSTAQG